MIEFFGESPKAQDGYLLDEYTFQGKTMNWEDFAYLQNRYIHGDLRTVDEVISINLTKWIQEKQRAELIINKEKDPIIKDQMITMYKNQCFALDNIFFGKEIHKLW